MKANHHYLNNLELEEKIKDILDVSGHINGQRRFPVGRMHFGNVSAGFASCEMIAVFNVLHDLGKDKRLSEIIYHGETNGYMLAGGFFGTKIYKIGKILEKYDVAYEREKVAAFIANATEGNYKDGQIFITTIRTRTDVPISHIHTFEMVHYRGHWVVYNRFDRDEGPSIYGNIFDVLKNGGYTGAYMAIYKIIDTEN